MLKWGTRHGQAPLLGRHRTDLLLLRANVSNLGSLGCFFWILAKAPADMLSLRSDQLGGLDVVCGSQCGVPPARVEEAQSAEVVMSSQKRKRVHPDPRPPDPYRGSATSSEAAPAGSIYWACITCRTLRLSIHASMLPEYPTILSTLAWPHLSLLTRRTLRPLTLIRSQWLSTLVTD